MASTYNLVYVLAKSTYPQAKYDYKHHSTFKNKGIPIVRPKLLQKYILKGKALMHKKKYKI